MEYEIKVGKIDYYTWKIGAIVLLLLCLVLIYLNNTQPTVGEINDNYWHLGYADCERNYNLTSDEQMLLNTYRANKIIYNEGYGLRIGENFTE